MYMHVYNLYKYVSTIYMRPIRNLIMTRNAHGAEEGEGAPGGSKAHAQRFLPRALSLYARHSQSVGLAGTTVSCISPDLLVCIQDVSRLVTCL